MGSESEILSFNIQTSKKSLHPKKKMKKSSHILFHRIQLQLLLDTALLLGVLTADQIHLNRQAHFAFRRIGTTAHALSYASVKLNLDIQASVDILKALRANILKAKNKYARQTKGESREWKQDHEVNEMLRMFDKLFQRVGQAIERCKFYMELKQQIFNQDKAAQSSRQKRFIFTIAFGIAALVTLATASTFLGVYNSVELIKLSKDANTLEITAATIGDTVWNNTKRIDGLATLTQELSTYVEGHSLRNSMQTTLNHMFMAVQQAEAKVVALGSIVMAMTSQRAAPNLLEALDIKAVGKKIEKQASDKGFTVLINHALDLFQCQSSFVATERGYQVLIHLPVARADAVLDLYQSVALPIPVHKDLQLSISNPKDIIAVNQDRSKFMTMSGSDLAACDTIGELYTCSNNNVAIKTDMKLQNKDSDMCLMAVFRQNVEAIKAMCSWNVAVVETAAVQLSPRKFVTYNKLRSDATITCPSKQAKDRKKHFTASGVSTLNVDPDCYVETKRFILYGADDHLEREFDVSWQWPDHDFKDIPTHSSFEKIHQLIAQSEYLFTNASTHKLEAVLDHMERFGDAPLTFKHSSWLSLLSGATTSIAWIIIAIIIITLVYKRCVNRPTMPAAVTIQSATCPPAYERDVKDIIRNRSMLLGP